MRKSGVLMHISSLSSPYGIGTMGKTAYDFVDFLKASGQAYWQILPICPTSYGDSPYQSYSTYAGNPYFIDLDQLAEEGLLDPSEYKELDWGKNQEQVDFGMLYQKRYMVLEKAVDRFKKKIPLDFEVFQKENKCWLEDFALFMTLKNVNEGKPWSEWSGDVRNREHAAIKRVLEKYQEDILFWKIIQYLFFKQWSKLKAYANGKGIQIIGDLPIYVAFDSVDVWAKPELFQLDSEKNPKAVAGCPPDGFSAVGQLWGNPLYDWEYMEQEDFSWWVERIEYQCKVYDVLRIDHFRGFDTYFSIPYGESTAQNGEWKQGPGMKLFEAVERQIGRQSIIAEDLGYLTDSVKQLLSDSGFPGMKVLEFAFDSRDANGSEYFPHKYTYNCVAYTGTHDNDTVKGWFEEASEEDVTHAKEYLRIHESDEVNWIMMETIWGSVAKLAIVQAQDLLGLGSDARMNKPSTVGSNWSWRAKKGSFTEEMAVRLKHKMNLYERC